MTSRNSMYEVYENGEHVMTGEVLEIAEFYGVEVNSVRNWYRRRNSQKVLRHVSTDHGVSAAGRSVDTELYHRRINQGFLPEVAAQPTIVPAKDMRIAQQHGLSKMTVYKRLKKGMTKHEALTQSKIRPTPEPVQEEPAKFTTEEVKYLIGRFKIFNIKLTKPIIRRAEEYNINISGCGNDERL